MCPTTFFFNFREKSKQLAEQAAAIVGITVLGLDDGRLPNTQSPNDEIAKKWRTEFQNNTEDDDSILRHKPVNSVQNGKSVENSGLSCSEKADLECNSDSAENCKGRASRFEELTESKLKHMNSSMEQNGSLPSDTSAESLTNR